MTEGDVTAQAHEGGWHELPKSFRNYRSGLLNSGRDRPAMEESSNGARLASNGLWVWNSGVHYGFGKTPHEAAADAMRRPIGSPVEHAALVEYLRAEHD